MDVVVALDVGDVDIVGEKFRTELGGGERGGVLVHEIDLLQRETFGLEKTSKLSTLRVYESRKENTNLGYTEESENSTAQTGGSPKEEDLDFEASVSGAGIDEVGGSVTDTEVPEPVGGNGERHGLGTDVEREDFASDDPSNGTPGGGEAGNVQADKGDEGFLAGSVLYGDGDTDDGDEELAHAHPESTPDEEGTTTEPLDTPHAGNGHEDVHDVCGDGGEEGVVDTGVLEERCAV